MGGIGIGWYGPLIDLSRASSHIGDYVQLLVFIHNSAPVQYKLSKGVETIRTDIQVGDDTRPFFSVSIWQKEMGSMVFPGAIVFLQNVRITKFQEIVEARTVQCSSLQCLVHPEELKVSKGVNDIIGACRTGVQTKEKLKKVIIWVNRAGSSIPNAASHKYQHSINWRVHEERVSQDCISLLQVSRMDHSCKVTFLASIGELFIPLDSRFIKETEGERMFISRRLCIIGDENLAEDLICNGCLLCGSPIDSQSRSTTEQSTFTLYCPNNSKHLHKISKIYRPFMLYVWDDSNCVPLVVKNKAAELIFGNLKAEIVHSCYKRRKGRTPSLNKGQAKDYCNSKEPAQKKADISRVFVSQVAKENFEIKTKEPSDDHPDFYLIWLILVKVLVQHRRNSPLRFKVEVNVDRDIESGRFELVSTSMPCF